MQQLNDAQRRVAGASLIGIGLIMGAVVVNNLRTGPVTYAPAAVTTQTIPTTVPARDFIAVTDSNGDGVEDWREEFVMQAPIELPPASTSVSFTMPTTVTDQVGIQLFESILRNKTNTVPGQSNEDIVIKTTSKIEGLARDTLYTNRDVTIIGTDPVAIRRYGNTMGQSLLNHNVVGSEGELEIMYQAVQTNDEETLKRLAPLAEMYKKLRDDAIATPVPDRFVEEHVLLINAYHAMYRNLSDFQVVFEDPIVALLRIKRYQDDATALGIALNRFYRNAAPFVTLFTSEDPAMIFSAFSN